MCCQEAKPRTYSSRSFVDVVEPVQHQTRLDRASYWPWPRFRRLQLERSMRSLLVVVPHELIEDGRQVPRIKHDHVVEALAAERPDDSLGHSVGVWGMHGVTIVVIPMRAARCMKSVR